MMVMEFGGMNMDCKELPTEEDLDEIANKVEGYDVDINYLTGIEVVVADMRGSGC